MTLQVEFYSITRQGCDATAKEILILGANREVKQEVATTGQSSGSRMAIRPRRYLMLLMEAAVHLFHDTGDLIQH